MAHPEVSRSKEPIRLFQSDFLEFFTHIHPAVVAAIYGPAVVAFGVWAVRSRTAGSALYLPLAFALGVAIWTLTEYSLHRFVFHHQPRTPRQERITFLFHGVHHAQPQSRTRLVMPPVVSIPLAALVYGVFWLVLDVLIGVGHWVAPLFCGFLAGYLAYDMTHYSLHHANIQGGYLAMVRKHHMRHHGQTPNMRFGVTSPFWDRVFGTEPAD